VVSFHEVIGSDVELALLLRVTAGPVALPTYRVVPE